MTDNNSVSRRRFLQATGGAASAAAIAGCLGGGEGDGTQTTTGGNGDGASDKVFKRINSSMTTLDPVKSTDTASGEVVQQLFDALMNYPNGEIAVEELLADSYEVSSDYTTYTFNLKDATYHNGDSVKAKDFIYAFERLAGSPNTRRAYFILSSLGVKHETHMVTVDGEEKEVYKPGSLDLEAPDDSTLKINLMKPFASSLAMLAYTSFAVYPQGIAGDAKGWDSGSPPKMYSNNYDKAAKEKHKKFATSNPVGSGPFKFNKWKSGTEAQVDRYEDYHGQVSSVKSVHWQIITDEEARYRYSMNKKSDTISMPTSKYDPGKVSVEETDSLGRKVGTYGPLDNGATANYLGVATINAFYIGMNMANVETPARKAMAYALNQEEVIQNVFKGRGASAYHFTPPNIYPGGAPEYTKHAKNKYPYGYGETMLDEAKAVMEDAGYSESNKYEFTFTHYASSSAWGDVGKRLRDKLSSAHITLNIESAPFSTLLSRGRKGKLDAYSLGWIMDWPAPDNFLQNAYPPLTDTDQEGGARGLYVDWEGTPGAQKATQAWEQIENNPEPTDAAKQKRNEAYVQMEEAMWEDMVLLPTYHRTDERFTYDWLDIPKFGGAGYSRQKYNNVSVGSRE